jgi:hypothetical protein
MSQFRWHDGPYFCYAGWDRPLQYHFLVVEDRASEEVVYSNLDDPEAVTGKRFMGLPPRGLTVEQVLARLKGLGIRAPAGLAERLREHQARDAGNEIVELTIPPSSGRAER